MPTTAASCPRPSAGGSSDNPGDYFKNGDVGIYFSGSWNYNPFVQDITSFKFGVMPLLSALQAVPLSWAVPVWPFPPTQRTKIWLLSS